MNEEQKNEEQAKYENLKKMMSEMMSVAYYLRNAPRDRDGRAVVSVVGIKNFGIFYLFEN